MGRLRRVDPVGGFHHVVNRGAARSDIFGCDRDRFEFERLIGIAHDRFGIRVRRLGGPASEALDELRGTRAAAAERMALSRARRRADDDPRLRQVLDEVVDLVA